MKELKVVVVWAQFLGPAVSVVDGLDLNLGLVVDFPSDEVGVGDLGVVVVQPHRLAVDLQVEWLGVHRRNWVRLGYVDGLVVVFWLMMMLKIQNCHVRFVKFNIFQNIFTNNSSFKEVFHFSTTEAAELFI